MNDKWIAKGKILKKEREMKGVSLQTVHEATKIPLDALKSIEEGYKVRTLTDFYYRAFIKLYANYLGIELTAILDDYKPQETTKPSVVDKKKTFWDEQDSFKISPEIIRKVAIAVVAFVFLFLLIRVAGCGISKIRNRPRPIREISEDVSDPTPAAERPVASRTQTQTPPQPVQAQAPVVQSPRPSKNVSLVVRAKKQSWLQVKVDGQIVFRSTLARGASGRWDADNEIELSGRNIRDLELEINGRLTSLGRTVRNIKGLIVTKDGFQIRD